MLFFNEIIDDSNAFLCKIQSGKELTDLKKWCKTTFGKSHGTNSSWRILKRQKKYLSDTASEVSWGTFVVIKNIEYEVLIKLTFG